MDEPPIDPSELDRAWRLLRNASGRLDRIARRHGWPTPFGPARCLILAHLDRATSFALRALGSNRPEEALAGATPYLRLFGLAQGGACLAKAALAASAALRAGETDPAHAGRIALARFFAENLATAAGGLEQTVLDGGGFVQDAKLALAG